MIDLESVLKRVVGYDKKKHVVPERVKMFMGLLLVYNNKEANKII